MSEGIRRFDWFEESQPRMCVWCRYCGYVDLGYEWGYVCIRSAEDVGKRAKGVIQPFPVNTGGTRTRVQCVNADEMHECFAPTKEGSERIGLLRRLGLLRE